MEAGNAHTWPCACSHPQAGTGGYSEAECPSPGLVLLFCTGLRKAQGLKKLIKELISKEKILKGLCLFSKGGGTSSRSAAQLGTGLQDAPNPWLWDKGPTVPITELGQEPPHSPIPCGREAPAAPRGPSTAPMMSPPLHHQGRNSWCRS